MSEVCTPPMILRHTDGTDLAAFGPDHTLADIARWIAQNKVEAEEMIHLLQEMVAA
jgi:hypothetical protein